MSNAMEWLQFVLAPQMINGLSIGVAVVLMALGLTIIFGLLDVINMAHGEFYAIGAYLAVALLATGMSFWWALVLTPLLMAVLGFVTERGLIQRVFHSKDRHTLTLLLTFGVVFDTIAVSPTIALIADMVLSVGLTPRALSNRS